MKTPYPILEKVKKYKKELLLKGLCRCCGKKREPIKTNRTLCITCSKKALEYARRVKPLKREKILQYQRKRYWENREKCLEGARKWREETRLKVYDKYGGRVCSCCEETRLPFLTLDHINNDGHETRGKGKDRSGGSTYLWAIKNNFPPVLRVLCYNCNSGRYRNGGICPHEEERIANLKKGNKWIHVTKYLTPSQK